MKPKLEDLTPENTAVIIIDMQDLFFEGHLDWNKIIENQIEIAKICKFKKIPIISLAYSGHGQFVSALRNILDGINIHNHIKKDFDDGFLDTILYQVLTSYNSKNTFLAGINATACVRSTAVGSLLNGFGIATSYDVIDNGADGFRRYGKGEEWYNEKGLFTQSFREIPLFQ